ncbi:MAG: hypothetical protein J7J36_04585, partial [Thermoplasmata archaeon]|nr:hypothetical protein [Thermoplasmata archaeon]
MKYKVLLIALILLISFYTIPSKEVYLFYVVGGHVRDEYGNGINNVTVIVTNVDKNITRITTSEHGEGGDGSYSVIFSGENGEFDWGDKIYVEARRGAWYGNATDVFSDTGQGYQVINVTVYLRGVYAIATSPIGTSNNGNITI